MTRKNRKLSREILGLLAVASVLALLLMQILVIVARAIIDGYIFMRDMVLTQTQYEQLDEWIFRLSLLISVAFFVILFLFLLRERLSYIREVLAGIEALREGQENYVIPLEGSNELTQLAEAVNFLSKTQKEIKEKEGRMHEEKEAFIHALSHDIRTPLTSIMAYSELLCQEKGVSGEEQKRYLKLIGKKANQMKELTDILLDGSKRNPEYFENAGFLMEQFAAEFEEVLEEEFSIAVSMECPMFSGTFDVQELHRIFDNLVSNVQKYAHRESTVKLRIFLQEEQLVIYQENGIRKQEIPQEGYQIGLRSIQRIVQNYEGDTEVKREDEMFAITIRLSVR